MADKPNMIFILPDQLRRDFLGCYGADFVRTPNIDGMAARGTQYDNAISQYPICVPARAALLTGLGAAETGVVDNGKWIRPDRLKMGIRTWPELLGQSGYHTASIGKMHFTPWDADEGFRERIISEDKRHYWIADDYADDLAKRGLHRRHGREYEGYVAQKGACINPVPDDITQDRWVADQTVEFLGRQIPDNPFALMVGFPSPHCPYDPTREQLESINMDALPRPRPETPGSEAQRPAMIANFLQEWADVDYSDLTEDQIMILRQHYAALVETVDREVGRILEALRKSEFARNTVVIFSSDHGDFMGDYRLVGKGSFYGPATDIPLIVTDFREDAQGGREKAPVALTDVFSTLLELAGVGIPSRQAGFPSLLSGIDPERKIFGLCPRGAMVVGPGFKFCRRVSGHAEAYDLCADPTEQNDLVAASGDDPRIAEYDAYLTKCLIEGMSQAHNDKSIAEAKARNKEAYGQRQWDRPYPAKISAESIRNI